MARTLGEWELTSEQSARLGLDSTGGLVAAVAQTPSGVSGGLRQDSVSGTTGSVSTARKSASLARGRQLHLRLYRRIGFD